MEYNFSSVLAGNLSEEAARLSVDDDATIPTYGLVSFRILIATIYALVCAAGLLGNFFVMYLTRARKASGLTAIDIFVFCLALSDFQFAFTLLFWAGDAITDFSWPFGHLMCKIILTMTVLNVYCNVFLLTAMAVTRYWLVASALSLKCSVSTASAKWISFGMWLLAVVATIPTIIFSGTTKVLEDELCLLKFPGKKWLAISHVQRVVLAFVIPLIVITTSYVMLLNFLRQHKMNGSNQHRQSRVTSSIQLVIMVFFICWFPNHAGLVWGILMKFEVVQWSNAYYYFHTYVFPLTICLAHSNSCLNPIIYCLMRKEFRKALKDLFQQFLQKIAAFLPSGKPVTMDQETSMPLYRKSSLPRTVSNDFHGPSDSTSTIIPETPVKDLSQPYGEAKKQETSMD
ncbi:relaxin-3 receptor 2 [Hyperolius riggenbachi]|uniref:relaxin-3 receptor 2 n=1 Tax=Hyperolius riggenbachi TaxID=752182 RepID=UPI0035A277DE